MTLIMYDFETSGRSPRFDQILQAGIIIYDENLSQVNQINLKSRLNSDIIPSIYALKVNKLNVSDLLNEKKSSFDLSKELHSYMKTAKPSIFLGYNSINFDEEFLRQALWESFFYPYLTTSNFNSRGDVLDLVRTSHAFNPNSINVELDDNGKLSFKLEKLSSVNNFSINNAHEAISDVKATKNVLEIVKNNSSEIYKAFMANTNKQNLIESIKKRKMFTHHASYYGKHFIFLLTYFIDHPVYKDYVITYDLKFDPEEITNISYENFKDIYYSKKKKFFRKLKLNKQPTVLEFSFGKKHYPYNAISPEILEQRIEILKNEELKSFMFKILSEEADNFEEGKSQEDKFEEQTIYDSNINFHDRQLMLDFEKVTWDKKWSFSEKFKDKRLRYFAAKHIYRENPELLPKKIFEFLYKKIAERLNSINKHDFTTIPAAIEEFASLSLKLEENEISQGLNVQLKQYKIYIDFMSDYYSKKNINPKPLRFDANLSKTLFG